LPQYDDPGGTSDDPYDGGPMPEPDEDEPTQFTPQGHEIPVPKKGAFDKLLRKVAKGARGNRHDGKGEPPAE